MNMGPWYGMSVPARVTTRQLLSRPSSGVRHFKTVHFYLMQVVGGDTANHDGEYDVVEWFPIGEALRRLSYPNEARVVDKAQQVLGAGPEKA